MWQRFFDRVLAETKVTERFSEHDLRAKCASDAKSLEHARAMLSTSLHKFGHVFVRPRASGPGSERNGRACGQSIGSGPRG
jgi:hypothetical protein